MKDRQRFWAVVAVTGFSGITALLGLANGVLTARMLGPAARGNLAIVLTATAILALISALGTNVSVRVQLPRGDTTPRDYFRTSFLLLPLCALATSGFVLLYGRYSSASLLALDVAFATVWISAAIYIGTQITDFFNALGDVRAAAFLNTAGIGFVSILLLISWSLGGQFRAALGSYCIGFTLRNALGLYLAHRRARSLPKPLRDSQRGLIPEGLRLLGMNLGQALTFRIDQLVLGVFRNSASVGIYAVAVAPASLVQLTTNAISQLVFRGAADGSMRRREVLNWTVASVLVASAVGGVMYVVAEPLVVMAFGNDFQGAASILRLLIVAEILCTPYLVLSRCAAGLRLTRLAGTSGIVGAALMLCCLFILVPLWGATGAALASLATYSSLSVVFVWMVLFRHDWDRRVGD